MFPLGSPTGGKKASDGRRALSKDSNDERGGAALPPSPRGRRGTHWIRTLFGLPHTPREGDQQDRGEVWHFPAEDREVLAVDHEEADRCIRDDRGGAGISVQQAHFAEELAGVDGHVLFGGHHDSRGPIKEQEELVAWLASTGQDGTSRDVEDPGDLGDTPELPLAAGLEERVLLRR